MEMTNKTSRIIFTQTGTSSIVIEGTPCYSKNCDSVPVSSLEVNANYTFAGIGPNIPTISQVQAGFNGKYRHESVVISLNTARGRTLRVHSCEEHQKGLRSLFDNYR